MNINDILTAKDNIIFDTKIIITKNKNYTIIDIIYDNILIIDDSGADVHINVDNIHNYFYDKKELRNKKLNSL